MDAITISSAMTPVASTIGGLIIGGSTSTNMYGNGRITGISGIFSGTLFSAGLDSAWKASFMSGMLMSAAAQAAMFPQVFGTVSASPAAAAVSGLLVGFGTSMGSGCTSGHGVCGLPRLSGRSWVAVSTFMAVGMMTASYVQATPWLRDWAMGGPGQQEVHEDTLTMMPWIVGGAGLALLLSAIGRTAKAGGKAGDATATKKKKDGDDDGEFDEHHHNTAKPENLALSWGIGAVFAAGLGLAGMTDPGKVLGFLAPFGSDGWDPSLAFVMGGAIVVNAVAFPLIFSTDKPMLGARWHLPTNKDITPSLVIGSSLFGIGWGLGGMCPGPAIVSVAGGSTHAIATVTAIVAGMSLHKSLQAMGVLA